MSDSGYYTAVNGLDLSNGDETGMWMLNYPFPYKDSTVGAVYRSYTEALGNVLEGKRSVESKQSLEQYLSARSKLRQLLSSRDYAYMSFQLWQEGIARYTEFAILRMLDNYVVSEAFKQLPDFQSFAQLREGLVEDLLQQLKEHSLTDHGRICFYTAGFAEGLILDRFAGNWKEKYLKEKFYLEAFHSNSK